MRRLFTGLFILALFALPALAQDAPPSDLSGVTVTEVAQIPRQTGPASTSAHLSPDGQRILHINRDVFCVLTAAGEEEACYTLSEQTGLHPAQVTPDHDTVVWSPDSRFVAYTVEGWARGNDMDIWLFAANTGQLTNLTDDGYDGSWFSLGGNDVPDTVLLDYAPAWKPDGTLTFARNRAADTRSPTELWSLRLGDAEPVKVADLHPDADEIGTVMSMDWSADGGTLAYTLYHSGDQSGLWLYDAASGQTELLLPDDREERGNAMRATFSPDALQILLLTSEREQFMTDRERDGHFIVSVETSEPVRLDPETWVMSAGWLPDGSGLIYTGRSAQFTEQGIYVSGNPAQAGRLALSGTIGEDEKPYNVYAPTNRTRSALKVAPGGTMLLGTSVAPVLIVVQVEGIGPIPVQAQTAPEAQATDAPEPTDFPRVTVAPPATETPTIDAGAQAAGQFTTVREVARLPFPSGPQSSSSHLLPDGETLINVHQNTFCEYSLEGEELWCVEAIYNDGEEDRPVRVDQESVTISPDGRYLAFTTDALMTFRDPDIWVLDLETQAYTNLTDDSYDGTMGATEDSSSTAFVDLAPTWRPDGMLTFARHSPSFDEAAPSLWVIDPARGAPEKLADFEATLDAFNLVMDMDWSSDGSRMAFVLDSQGNPFGGLWLYEAEDRDMRPLVVPPEREGFLTAEFSPDGQSILLQTAMHAAARATRLSGTSEDNGYFIVSLDGRTQKVQAPLFIQNTGWLPDGSLVYLLYDQEERSSGGIFIAASASETAEKAMDLPTLEDRENAMLLGPTPRQWPMLSVTSNGRFVLGSPQPVTLVVEAVASQTESSTILPAATGTPELAVSGELGPVSVREVARLPFSTGPAATTAHLLPDGETLIHSQMHEFCAYTLDGEELWCVEAIQHIDGQVRRIHVDPESITLSPNGRYLAFTSDALYTFRDPDIWVLDIQERTYTNLTEDRYEGSIALSDDIPEGLPVDLAPAWHPDGMLTFARHTHDIWQTIPSLWMVDPAGGEPQKLADFEGVPGNITLVFSMDWSPDGSRMAFVLDNVRNPFGGLWVYEAEDDNVKPLVIPPEDDPGFLRADFAPDSQSILLMTMTRDIARSGNPGEVPDKTGYFVVSADTGRVTPVQADSVIMGIGWLPDSRLLYAGHMPVAPEDGGLFVLPAEGGDAVKVMEPLEHEGELLRVFSPTPRQWPPISIGANGRFVLGSALRATPVLEVATE
jgi:Tol biopolymer transport system component